MVRAYTDIHVGRAPTAAMQENFTILAGLNANGQVSDAQVLSNLVNGVDDSTALAIVSYQFFTGKSPTQEGLAYLVNSTVNANDLNDAYYARFNLENRYINFAANLGVNGQGATAFAAKYGAMSFSDYVASIYETIIGAKYATAAGVDVAAAVAYLIGTKDAVLATVAGTGMIDANSTPAQVDIALKAAMAGLVMAASIKADIGLYAAAADNFMIAIATHTAVYNTDITRTYAPEIMSAAHGTGKAVDRPVILPSPTPETPATPSSYTFRLSTGTNQFVGGALDDVFNADETNANVLTAGDFLNGGPGQDTLNIVHNGGASYLLNGGALTVKNIETINISFHVFAGPTTADMSTWTGVTQLNATIFGNGSASAILRAPTSPDLAITMSDIGRGSLIWQGGHDVNLNVTGMTDGGIALNTVNPTGAVTITVEQIANSYGGGSIGFTATGNVSITQTASNAVGTTAYMAKAFIGGGVDTTSVVVHNAPEAATDGTHAGVAYNSGGDPSVQINDVNGLTSTLGVIAYIDLDGYRGARIRDNALATLKLAHGGGDVQIQNGGGAVGAPTALNLFLNAVDSGVLSDQGVYRTLNVTTGASASTLDNINASALTALNLGGASNLTLTSTSGLSSLQTVTVTGAAGITANLSGATVTAIDASASAGANTVTIDASKATYAGGSGVDKVTLATLLTHAINLGAGDDVLDVVNFGGWNHVTVDGGAGAADVLRISSVNANTGLYTFTNFERLEVVGGGGGLIDVAPYDHVTVNGGGGMALTGLISGDTLVLNGPGTSYNLVFSDPNPTLNLQLTDNSGTDIFFASAGITAAGLETLNISVSDSQITTNAFRDALVWRGDDVKTITIGGAAGLVLIADSTALTLLDASGMTSGGLYWNAGYLSGAATIKGASQGTNHIGLATATNAAVTYVGGAGADSVIGDNHQNNIIDLGGGNNDYFASVGDHRVTAGSGNDIVNLGDGNNTVILGDGFNTLNATDGANSYTGGAGVDTVSVGGGANAINVGSGNDAVSVAAANVASNTVFTSITGFGAGDTLFITAQGGATRPTGALGAAVTVGGSPTLQDYLNAAAVGDGHTTSIMSWFKMGADTYVVLDSSAANTFTAGSDIVVKLVGVSTLDLAGHALSSGVLTL